MTDQLAGTGRKTRDQSIEMLRILAAFGIIAYHSDAPFKDVAYAGLVVFLVLSPLLDAKYNWEKIRPFSQMIRYYLVPWIFWLCVYAAINFLQKQPLFHPKSIAVLYGSSPHLWFLPFMFVVLLVMSRLKSRPPVIGVSLSAVLAALLLATAVFWRPVSYGWAYPLPQWLHALPAVLIGVVLGFQDRMGPAGRWSLGLVLVGLAAALWAWRPGVAIPYGLGVGLVIVTVYFGKRWLPQGWNVQPLSACMMGVYLTHIIVLKVVGLITGPSNYLTVCLAFLLASGGVWAARRYVPVSKVVLG